MATNLPSNLKKALNCCSYYVLLQYETVSYSYIYIYMLFNACSIFLTRTHCHPHTTYRHSYIFVDYDISKWFLKPQVGMQNGLARSHARCAWLPRTNFVNMKFRHRLVPLATRKKRCSCPRHVESPVVGRLQLVDDILQRIQSR